MKRVSGEIAVMKCMVFVLLTAIYSSICIAENWLPGFDALQKPAQEIDYYRETVVNQMLTDGEWVDTNMAVNTYEDGIWTEIIAQTYANGVWKNTTNGFLTYDEQGNLIEALSLTWTNGEWVDDYRENYTYDGQGNQIEELGQMYVNGEWENYSRTTNTYDSNGNMTESITERWRGGTWETLYQEANTFDEQGNMIESLQGTTYNNTTNIAKCIYTYDGEGRKIEELRQTWQELSDDFTDSRRTTYTYNEQGGLTEELEQYPKDGEWIDSECTSTTYDEDGRTAESVYTMYMSGEVYNSQRQLYSYDFVTVIAQNSGDTPAEILLTANYPNPFNLSTTIRFALSRTGHTELVIFNVMGQKVRSLLSEEVTSGEHAIVWDGCDDRGIPVTTGVFFSRLTTGNSSVSGRMMLVK
ncbi:T9SS type A sorting domain-containing protein [Candidatus Latescibacterota bacterium]